MTKECRRRCGVVSPPLLGSCGTLPLTITSPIPFALFFCQTRSRQVAEQVTRSAIMQHYYDVIVLAEREVLLATNYLQCVLNPHSPCFFSPLTLLGRPSDSQRKVCAALKELSRRVGERGQKEKIVVKRSAPMSPFQVSATDTRVRSAVMYDRGNWRQAYKNHQPVKPLSSGWRNVDLPDPKDIPNLSLEVINFHRVLLGTFHAK